MQQSVDVEGAKLWLLPLIPGACNYKRGSWIYCSIVCLGTRRRGVGFLSGFYFSFCGSAAFHDGLGATKLLYEDWGVVSEIQYP